MCPGVGVRGAASNISLGPCAICLLPSAVLLPPLCSRCPSQGRGSGTAEGGGQFCALVQQCNCEWPLAGDK